MFRRDKRTKLDQALQNGVSSKWGQGLLSDYNLTLAWGWGHPIFPLSGSKSVF
jgi:hypothetical protein